MTQNVPAGKREVLARFLDNVGVRSLLMRVPTRPSFLVLNYHRIGDRESTPYDPSVFSASAEQFRMQMEFIGRQFNPVSLPQALSLIAEPEAAVRETCHILITFDDGYLDNYEIAFPILQDLGIPAVFFVPTSFIGERRVPWWDTIAFILKGSKRGRFRLSYPVPREVDFATNGFADVLQCVLRHFKLPSMRDPERFLSELETACDSQRPGDAAERCFLNWGEAHRMVEAGMAVEAHTHSHTILSQLPADRQREELLTCRDLITQYTGVVPVSLAYPVGMRDSFTEETKQIARELGYQAAFSFYGGVNRVPCADAFDVLRVGIGGQSPERFRTQLTFARAFHRWWP